MRVTLNPPESERKRQDRFVRLTEKLVQHGTLRRDPRPLRTHPTAQMNALRRLPSKHLIGRQNQVHFRLSFNPLGECWLMLGTRPDYVCSHIIRQALGECSVFTCVEEHP
jgi:hypothetical protein